MKGTGGKGLWNLPLKLRRATEARQCVSGALMKAREDRGPERSSSDAVKVRPGLCWRHETCARVMSYLPGRSAGGEWIKTEVCCL